MYATEEGWQLSWVRHRDSAHVTRLQKQYANILLVTETGVNRRNENADAVLVRMVFYVQTENEIEICRS